MEDQENSNVVQNALDEIKNTVKIVDSNSSTTCKEMDNIADKPRRILGDIHNNKCNDNNKVSTNVSPLKTVLKPFTVQDENSNTANQQNQTNLQNNVVPEKKTIKRSSSFPFSEKLFLGSKFSMKRNPRKSLPFPRRKSEISFTSVSVPDSDNSNLVSENSCDSSVLQSSVCSLGEQEVAASTVSVSEVTNDCDVFSSSFTDDASKPKVIQKTPVINHQAISIIHSAVMKCDVDDTKLTSSRKLDKGWVERCSRVNSLDHSIKSANNDLVVETDSPQHLPNNNVGQSCATQDTNSNNNPKPKPSQESDSENSVISDSDTEDSPALTRILSVSRKRKPGSFSGLTSFNLTNKRLRQGDDHENNAPATTSCASREENPAFSENCVPDVQEETKSKASKKRKQAPKLSKKEMFER